MAEEGEQGDLLSGLFGKASIGRGRPSRRDEGPPEVRGSARQYRKRVSEEDVGGMY